MAAIDPDFVLLNESIDRIYAEARRIRSNNTMSVQDKEDALSLLNTENGNLRRSTAQSLTYEHAKMKTNHDLIQTMRQENNREGRRARRQTRRDRESMDEIGRCVGGVIVLGALALFVFAWKKSQ